ncbi:MAG: gamma-glutamyl-gamma-aminobutyrate hydrolase family protein [Candidatus Rokuibacteriota bacterium]
MTRPLIGVGLALSVGEYPERAYVNMAYLRAIEQAGGVPVPLAPGLEPATLEAVWQRIDGLVLTGGWDMDPARYGQARHPKTENVSETRDAVEVCLVSRALGERVPLFAICRGLQVLNVALGGSLVQDIADDVDTNLVHSQKELRDVATHEVRVAADSRLHAIVGAHELRVNSMHHQAIGRVGRDLRAVAWAPDGVIEGVEMGGDDRFVVAVQWHPEELVEHDPAARALFTALVDAARRRR